jgi:hypothetical protein
VVGVAVGVGARASVEFVLVYAVVDLDFEDIGFA